MIKKRRCKFRALQRGLYRALTEESDFWLSVANFADEVQVRHVATFGLTKSTANERSKRGLVPSS